GGAVHCCAPPTCRTASLDDAPRPAAVMVRTRTKYAPAGTAGARKVVPVTRATARSLRPGPVPASIWYPITPRASSGGSHVTSTSRRELVTADRRRGAVTPPTPESASSSLGSL